MSIPPTANFEVQGDLMIDLESGKIVDGASVYLGRGKSAVYLYKTAFTSKEMLYLTMSHEYIHAGFNYCQKNTVGDDYQHAAIYKWQMEQAKMWNIEYTRWETSANSFNDYYRKTIFNCISDMGFGLTLFKPW